MINVKRLQLLLKQLFLTGINSVIFSFHIPTFILFLFFLSQAPAFSQNQNKLWFFGWHGGGGSSAGMDFSGGSPVQMNGVTTAGFYEATTVQSNGAAILFYSNGHWVRNKNHVIMPNGSGLTGSNGPPDGSAAQGVVSFPYPGSATKYILMTPSAIDGTPTNGIRWTEIDMTLDGGNGNVTANKDIKLTGADAVTEMLGVYAVSCNESWVVGHEYNSNNFIVIHVTAAGPQAPVKYAVGPNINSQGGGRGSIKISPDGKKLAMVGGFPTGMNIFDFNSTTGVVSNAVAVGTVAGMTWAYGAEWSPNSRYAFMGGYTGINGIIVYDVQNSTGSSLTAAGQYGVLQMGPDGVIYVAPQANGGNLSTIANPDNGATATFTSGGYVVGGDGAWLGLPQSYSCPSALPCGDTTLAASIPAMCTGAGTFDLDLYKGSAAAGTWSIITNPGTASIAGDGHTFNFNNTIGGTCTVRYALTTVNPGCPASADRSFVIYSASVGGTVTADATVCSGANGATLTLAGHTGSITSWESSTDNFATSTTIANTTNTQAYLNLTVTTKYRAIVKSGTCASANSAAATITVNPATVGGTVTADATVCSGVNSGLLTLSGYTGTITGWESSTDNFATTNPIVNTSASQSYSNISTTTKYRAIVKSGICASANSAAATITVDPATVGGTVTADATVCSGANGATLTLAGHTGSITSWESSTDNFATSTTIANTTNTQAYLNLTVTTKYRAIVKSGTCASANSAAATITVDPATVGGTVTADATVCSGANSGTLILAGNTGSVTGWESSTDNFATSTPIVNTTTSQTYTNIAITTQYRAIVKSGTCASANGTAATITVDPVSVGGTVTADATVCSGTNSGTLTLAGYTGTITGWESSTDNFATTTPIVNVTNSQLYNNLTVTTQYRAIVKSGTCSSDNSLSATITVNDLPTPFIADATICFGDPAATFDAGAYVSYVWSDNGTGTVRTTTGTTPGNYTCEVTDINGCKASATGVLTVNALPVVVLADTSVCPGGSITLAPSPAVWVSYEWNSNPLLNTATLSYNLSNTTVTVRVEDANGCFNTATANIALGDTLHVDFGADKQICSYASVTLDAAEYGPFSSPVYTWDGVAGTSTKTINQSGQYGVSVMDSRGCMGSDTVLVTVNSAPQVSLGADTTVCFTGHEQWFGFVADTFSTVLWSTGSTDTNTFTDEIGDVWVSVSNSFTCIDSDTIHVGEYCEPTPLCFPDVMTPNGDDENDVFTPCIKNFVKINNGNYKGVIDNITFVNFVVYDRWGIKMFQSKDIIPLWDGTFEGRMVTAGTYYWIIRYIDSSRANYEQTGYITVINN